VSWIISPLDTIGRTASSLRKDPFNSGNAELDRYLKQYALKTDLNGISKTFVAFPIQESQIIACYYFEPQAGFQHFPLSTCGELTRLGDSIAFTLPTEEKKSFILYNLITQKGLTELEAFLHKLF